MQTLSTRLKETEEVKTKLEIELRVTRCITLVIPISRHFHQFNPIHSYASHRFNLERDVADARAQVAATVAAEKQSIDRAKAADKKLEEAKIVFSAAKQEAAAQQTKIKSLSSDLSATQTELQQASSALEDATRSRRVLEDELRAIKSQSTAGAARLEEQLRGVEIERAETQAQVDGLRNAAIALEEEVKEARSAATAQAVVLEAKLAEAKAALASETADLKLRLSASENLCSVHQQQQQQELARQERERTFMEHKIAKMAEQQSAAAAAESAAAAARAAAELAATSAKERVAAVSAVFKKMANLDEGLEGDCTCLSCMQGLADPVLLQVCRSHALLCARMGLMAFAVWSFVVFKLCSERARMRRVRRGHPAGPLLHRSCSLCHAMDRSHAYADYQKPMVNVALGILISKLNFRRQVMEQLLTKHAVS